MGLFYFIFLVVAKCGACELIVLIIMYMLVRVNSSMHIVRNCFSYPLLVCIQLKNSGMYEILVQLAEESVLQLFVCSLFYMKMKLKY